MKLTLSMQSSCKKSRHSRLLPKNGFIEKTCTSHNIQFLIQSSSKTSKRQKMSKFSQVINELESSISTFQEHKSRLKELSRYKESACGQTYDLQLLDKLGTELLNRLELWKYVGTASNAIAEWKATPFRSPQDGGRKLFFSTRSIIVCRYTAVNQPLSRTITHVMKISESICV